MGFETRGGRTYYYRKERSGGRVRSVYHGGGAVAEMSALMAEMDAEERAQKRRQERERRAELLAEDAELDALGKLVDELARATLLTHGYHQHKRQWRRRRR